MNCVSVYQDGKRRRRHLREHHPGIVPGEQRGRRNQALPPPAGAQRGGERESDIAHHSRHPSHGHPRYPQALLTRSDEVSQHESLSNLISPQKLNGDIFLFQPFQKANRWKRTTARPFPRPTTATRPRATRSPSPSRCPPLLLRYEMIISQQLKRFHVLSTSIKILFFSLAETEPRDDGDGPAA